MTANIVCFVSSKGGSGKTVTSAAMGTFLASLGFKVLLVDTDAATNGMTLLFLDQLLGNKRKSDDERVGLGLFDAGVDQAPSFIAIEKNLHFVPATFSMRDTETVDVQTFFRSLKHVLSWKGVYDFVLLDAQAGADVYAKFAASVSDRCVIVSEYDPVSAQGIDRLKILFGSILEPTKTWTLFNKILPEFASAIGKGLSIARYLAPVPWDADVVRAFARRDLAIDMKAPNAYTISIAQLILELFPDETWATIERWRGKALEENVSPAKQRMEELKETILYSRHGRFGLLAEKVLPLAGISLAIISAAVVALPLFEEPLKSLSGSSIDPRIFLVSALPILVTIFAGIEIVRARLGRRRAEVEQALKADLAELQKLQTALQASEALMKFEGGGYYSERRRAPERVSE